MSEWTDMSYITRLYETPLLFAARQPFLIKFERRFNHLWLIWAESHGTRMCHVLLSTPSVRQDGDSNRRPKWLPMYTGEAIVRFEDTSGKLRVLKILEPIQQTNSDGVDVPEIKEGFLMPFLDVRTNTLSERARLRTFTEA
ncbi:hypothetical protein NM688_g108 [Phlebia brevispora]|uniref:Uncharacterized protein n=1 Tax=Phlebia brevispora TaxID=194682 RepID=A0ACC1TFC8_9APHY|nr:hypothetical protein NM688_g108 [Phlebia brevispora]